RQREILRQVEACRLQSALSRSARDGRRLRVDRADDRCPGQQSAEVGMIGLGMRTIAVGLALVAGAAMTLDAQGRRGGAPPVPSGPGTIERVTVSGNDLTVYLPASYATDAARRFPVVYLLAERPVDVLKLPEAADKLSTAQGFSAPMVVMSDTPPSA